jgi:hypothetical protein
LKQEFCNRLETSKPLRGDSSFDPLNPKLKRKLFGWVSFIGYAHMISPEAATQAAGFLRWK